jgi:hypothetical protein
MKHQTQSTQTAGTASSAANSSPVPVVARRTIAGFGTLPFVVEKATAAPATNATWAWSLRRFGRAAVWFLPGYGVLLGIVAFAGTGTDPAPYAAGGRLLYLIGWVGAVWLGALALMALTSLLVAARSRRIALAGLLVGLAGTLLMLAFAGIPDQTPAYGGYARGLALAGATLYTLGWLLTGWAVVRSGVFSYADGGILMFAAPLLGIGGMLIGALQGYGAVLALAGGIGIAWRAARLMPVGRATPVHSAAEAVAAHSPTAGTQPAH